MDQTATSTNGPTIMRSVSKLRKLSADGDQLLRLLGEIKSKLDIVDHKARKRELSKTLAKLERSENRKFYWGASDWLLWLHVQEVSFVKSVISFVFVIVFAAAVIPNIDWKTALLLGYSVDSTLDLIFNRFDAFVAAGRTPGP